MNSDERGPACHADTYEHIGAASSSPDAEPDQHTHALDGADDVSEEQVTRKPVKPLEGYERL